MTAEAAAVANNFGVLMVSIQDAVNPTFTNNTMHRPQLRRRSVQCPNLQHDHAGCY
jgi:hypothetical protein